MWRRDRLVLALTFALGAGNLALGQEPLGEAYWQGIRAKADSVLVAEFGKEFREKHLFPIVNRLDYIAIGDRTEDWGDRDTITQIPDYCFFEYDVGFDQDHSSRNNIMITITPSGGRVPESIEPYAEWNGLASCQGACEFASDFDGFVARAKELGVHCRRKDAFYGLAWVRPDSLQWQAGERRGGYHLILVGRRKEKGKTETLCCTSYWYRYEGIVFDAFSGDLIKREDIYDTYRYERSMRCL